MAGLPQCRRQAEAGDPAWGRKALASLVKSSGGTVQVPSLPWQLSRYADSTASAPSEATCHHGAFNHTQATGQRPQAMDQRPVAIMQAGPLHRSWCNGPRRSSMHVIRQSGG